MSKPRFQIETAVPPVHVSDRNVLQWLRGMNIPIGVPITIQFFDDLVRDVELALNCGCFYKGLHNCPVHK